jgi:hypothetical protein
MFKFIKFRTCWSTIGGPTPSTKDTITPALAVLSSKGLPIDVVQSATEALSLLADHLTDIFPSADCSVFIQGAHALRDFLPTESLPDNSIVLEPLELGISLAACKVSVEKEGTKDGLFDVGNLDVNSVSVVLLSVLLEQVVSAVDDLQKQGAVNATKVINTLSELTDKCRAIKKEFGCKGADVRQ